MLTIRSIIIQIFHIISSNFIKLFVVGLLTIIVPKFIEVESYGYWQLYIFYTNYVGFFHLGWCDGIYLKEGGKNFDELCFSSYKTQFFSLLILQFFFGVIILIGNCILNNDIEKSVIIIGTCINAILAVPCTMLGYLMQTTGKIKDFSFATIIGRITYFILVILSVLGNYISFYWIIIADLIGWLTSLLYSCYACKEIFKVKANNFKLTFSTILNNIEIGSKLMIANIASSLIIGIVRFFIEKHWSIEIFGKISLSINFCSLVLIFINAISIVLYPILKKMKIKDLGWLYKKMDFILFFILMLSLLFYFPINIFTKFWLPEYEVSIYYMAILFPICIYESKVSLLIYTFLKVLRKERVIMIINLTILFLGIILSYLTVFIIDSLVATVYCILILLFLRCLIFELLIKYFINVNTYNSIIKELIITFLFLIISTNFNSTIGLIAFLFICSLLILSNKKTIVSELMSLKKFGD